MDSPALPSARLRLSRSTGSNLRRSCSRIGVTRDGPLACPLATFAVSTRNYRSTSTPVIRRVGPDFTRQPLTAWRQKSRLNPHEAHRTVVTALETARFAEALAEDPRALVSLLEFAPVDPAADASQSAKNSYATRQLAGRSAPPGVRPPRETMVALDGAVHGQFGGIHCHFRCSSLQKAHGTGVSDCVLGSTARDISGSNPSRSTRRSARPGMISSATE